MLSRLFCDSLGMCNHEVGGVYTEELCLPRRNVEDICVDVVDDDEDER